MFRSTGLVLVAVLGCGKGSPAHRDQDEYVQDVTAFTHESEQQVRDKIKRASAPIKEEWDTWAKQGPMTPERIKTFYKQTQNYIYDLGEWHLWSADKRQSDAGLVEQVIALKPKNVLDFGGGVGLDAIPLAKAGLDVTLADLDSTTLKFGLFHAEHRGVHLKAWKSDVEPAPPDPKYDVILVLDVLEHLPADELDSVVDKLIRLKTPTTKIILNAPFGKTAKYPMHMDEDEHTKQQVHRLETELPKA